MTNKLPSQEAMNLVANVVSTVGKKIHANDVFGKAKGCERFVKACDAREEAAISELQAYIQKLEDETSGYSSLERYLGILLRINRAEKNGDEKFIKEMAATALELWHKLNSLDRILVGHYLPIIEQLKKED